MLSKKTRYPPWVRHGKLVKGDTCLRYYEGIWIKEVYTGNRWTNYDTASKELVKQADIRASLGRHIIASRKA